MKDYYVSKVQVIIDGGQSVIEYISGQGFNPNMVKTSAVTRAKEKHQGTTFAPIILHTDHYTLQEYKAIIGGNPPWLIGH